MKKIVLRRADLNKYYSGKDCQTQEPPVTLKICTCKNLQSLKPPNTLRTKRFSLHLSTYGPETCYLTTCRRLSARKLRVTNTANLTNIMEATGFEFKHDYTVIDSPRAVTFRDRYGVQMIMRFNEIHRFSDGTLQQIDEALDYRVKEFQINRTNPGMNTRFWTKKDVDRSKDFMFAIQKRLKTRRIFRNLESFVGGRIREGDYRLLKRTE
ncbi:hypothetical protein Tco_1108509 [Tanacetum coccineum]